MSPLARVRLRLTWKQRRAFVLTVLAYQVLVWADALLNQGRFGGDARTAVAGAVFLVMAAATWWIGASVSGRGLIVHALPPMVIPWSQVREIEVQRQLGSSVVVVHHGHRSPDGSTRRTRLSAPTTGPLVTDEAFQEKVAVLRGFWAAHRTDDRAA